MTVHLHVLGELRIVDGSRSQRPALDRRFGVLVYLAYAGDWVERDRLATLFWPDVSTARARTNLRSLLARVRQLPFARALVARPDSVAWSVASDVGRFRSAVAQDDWAAAVAAYGGELLPGADFDGVGQLGAWVAHERERLREAYRRSAMARCDELARSGLHAAAAEVLEGVLDDDPFDEELLRRAVRAHAAAGARDRALRLGKAFRERLERELELAPSAETERVLEELSSGNGRAAPVASGAPADGSGEWDPAGLPLPLTPFVGRDRELREVAQRLARPDCRLLTLTGIGGVGKTRLALQLAIGLHGRYRDGAHFVALGAARSPLDVAMGIAETLGLALPGDADAETVLGQALADREALLVLDDFDGAVLAAPLLVQVMAASPGVDIVVTSRERLGLGEEWLVRVAGLDHPPAAAAPAVARATDACRLFLDAARRVDPDFPPDERAFAEAVRICRSVEGLPLGIELAAAGIRSMPIADLAGELDHNLDLLRRTPRSRDDRHRSIRAAFESSWARLSGEEAETLAALGAFHGGFRREAAAEVVGATLPVLAALVDKSLLRLDRGGRYGAHPLVEGFAREKLSERPEVAERVRRAHAAYYASWTTDVRLQFERHAEPRLGELIAAEYANLMAVVEAAVAAGRSEDAARLVTSLAWYWAWRGRTREARARLERVLELPFPEGSVVRATTMVKLANVLTAQGELDRAFELEAEACAVVEAGGDVAATIRTLAAFAAGLAFRARFGEAFERLERARALAVDTGFVIEHLEVVCNLAIVATRTGDLERARTSLREAMAIATRNGNRKFVGIVHVLRGRVERLEGDLVAARRLVEEGLRELRASRHTSMVASACFHAGIVALAAGDHAAARGYLAEALASYWDAGTLGRISELLRAVAALEADHGDVYEAGLLASAAETMRSTAIPILLEHELAALDGAIARARRADRAAFESGAELARAQAASVNVERAARILGARADPRGRSAA